MDTGFAYVYVVYYYDPHETDIQQRYMQVDIVVFSSFRRCLDLTEPKTNNAELQEISKNVRWRQGNYWIERHAIIDSYNHGLDFVQPSNNGQPERLGRIELKLDDE